jgi:hypothetical protein
MLPLLKSAKIVFLALLISLEILYILYIRFIHYKIEKLQWDALPLLTFQKKSAKMLNLAMV